MPKNIFVDLNVIIDVFLERDGFGASRDILQLGEQSACQLYISAHAVTTFVYLLEDAQVPRPKILEHIGWLLGTFSVVATGKQLLEVALKSHVSDYEDAVVEQAAAAAAAKVIVTNNVRDFKFSTVPAQTPRQYLQKA